ncbi:hypothetical protein KR032_001440 [Drosophila birchii]|nr:hypothetical protein KR032_001440 [Drosophila birchii]
MANIVELIFVCGLIIVAASEPKDTEVMQDFQYIKQLRSLGLLFDQYLQDNTTHDLGLQLPRLPSQDDLLCLSDWTQFMTALQAGQYWALKSKLSEIKKEQFIIIFTMKVIDAWGSIPPGILTGNVYGLGNFDECLNIKKEVSLGRTIRGKYCFLGVSPGEMLGIDRPIIGALSIRTATCFPASCSAVHMNTIVGQLIKQFLNSSIPSTSISIIESSCQTDEPEPWDGLTIFTVVILSLMSATVAIFTLYDYFFCECQDKLPAVVKVFSARANSRALFRVVENKSNPNVIDCLHGIRCLSLIWVVYCHQYTLYTMGANLNILHYKSWSESPYASFVVHGFFSVDSFFFLGGMLVSLIALRSMEKTRGKLNVPMMYLHRLMRILPLLAISIPVYIRIMRIVSGGPMFSGGYMGTSICESTWYWTLLFVNNYVNTACPGHTWYLSVDMQLFILSPILLISIYKWGKKAAAGIVVLIVLLSGCLFATMMVNNYSMLLKNSNTEATRKLYLATHTHAAPWLIGFLFGYFLHLNRGKKFRLSRVSVWSGWILCLAMIFTSIFAVYPYAKWGNSLSTVAEASYYTLTRVGWPLALGWVVFAGMQGYGGLANSFLSHPLWQPLSKLSYSVYIWHMFVEEVNARSVRTNSYFSDYRVMLAFWSSFGITLVFSYFMHLIIEAPFGGLDIFLRPKPKIPAISNEKDKVVGLAQLNETEENGPTNKPPDAGAAD